MPPRPRANTTIRIGTEVIAPGHTRRFDLRFARLPTGTWESIPIAVINGRRPGPTVWLSAAIHGDEINGVEIIRRVLRRLEVRRLAGAVIAVPVVNVFGFVNQSRYLPDRRDLNRCFPGSTRGSLAARLAHLFLEKVVSQCELGIDLHTAAGHRTNLPQIRANLDDPDTGRLAEAFGAPFAVHARVRDGSLRQAATERGITVLLYEAGGTQRFETGPIEAGVAGVLRVLQAREMGTWDVPVPEKPIQVRKTTWVRASRSGIAVLDLELGQKVEKGEKVGSIGDAHGGRTTRITATETGFAVARTLNPLVSQGDALFHIAVPGISGQDEPPERRRLSL